MTRPALPVLGPLLTGARRVLGRFPVVMACSALAALAATMTIDSMGPEPVRARLLISALLGLPLGTALTVYAERRWGPSTRHLVVGGVVLVVLGAFFAAVPRWSDDMQGARFVQLGVAFHLGVAFLPFVGRHQPTAFWQFNRVLFERFLLAALYAGALFAGLALALAALDQLFGIDVVEEGYARLWVVVAFVFNPWFFLAGVPDDVDGLERRTDFPAGLKAFTRFLLVPLVIVYLTILTVYLAKVLVTWDWPRGWIGYLVSSVAGVGILSLLLVHPLAEREGNGWIATFARGFWIALFPAIVMLWLAIAQRVGQYGMTERRYFLLVLSIWLAAVAIYFTITGSRRLVIVPSSLFAVAVLSFGGPWGAYRVSERSQVGRLAGLLQANGLLVDGIARRATGEVPFDDRREISAILRYLAVWHGMHRIDAWFEGGVATIDTLVPDLSAETRYANDRARLIAGHLGVAYVERWVRTEDASGRFTYSAEPSVSAIPVAGFDFALPIRRRRAPADTGLVAVFVPASQAVRVWRGATRIVDVPLGDLLARLDAAWAPGRTDWPPETLRVEIADPRARVVVIVEQMGGRGAPQATQLEWLEGMALVALRP